MRLPRVRVTVRRLMVGVAVTALALAADQVRRRRADYLGRAAINADAEQMSRAYADDARGPHCDPQRVERGDALAAYHAALRLKYERAARRPWLPVAPDPPEP